MIGDKLYHMGYEIYWTEDGRLEGCAYLSEGVVVRETSSYQWVYPQELLPRTQLRLPFSAADCRAKKARKQGKTSSRKYYWPTEEEARSSAICRAERWLHLSKCDVKRAKMAIVLLQGSKMSVTQYPPDSLETSLSSEDLISASCVCNFSEALGHPELLESKEGENAAEALIKLATAQLLLLPKTRG